MLKQYFNLKSVLLSAGEESDQSNGL